MTVHELQRHPRLPPALAARLRRLASRHETAAFAESDPIGCLRGASTENLETSAFVAASLSYGRRTQFLPKIRWIFDQAGGDIHGWILAGSYSSTFSPGDNRSFYRLFSYGQMHAFFSELHGILSRSGSLGTFLRDEGVQDAPSALHTLCSAFGGRAVPIIPKDATSACKRLCMFLRWMVRDDSPVDFGIWSDWIGKHTLIVPLDTHVLRQANRLGLLHSNSATMHAARLLTAQLATVFPGDPCKGDFALYGLGADG